MKRVLGHQRIFQSVFNDLKMSHEIVTDKDGRKRYAYVYDGADPYELEDTSFPNTVKAIEEAKAQAEKQALEWVLSQPTGEQTMSLEQMKETPDSAWRDEVVQYFFNTDCLRFNIQRRIEDLTDTTPDKNT